MWIVYLLTTIHVIVCLFLVIVVLLQSGKAADLAGAFGGMGSQTAFGPRGAATVLSKATTIAAGLFMVTSISLSIMGTRTAGVGTGSKSVIERTQSTAPKPVAPSTVPLPLPGSPAGAAPGAPGAGQPSVTLKDAQGNEQTIPLKLPQQTPENTVPAPAQKK